MTILKLILTLIFLSGFLAYAASGGEESLTIRNLAKGGFSSVSEAKQKVIKDKAEWERIWADHSASLRRDAKIPQVDFTREMVIFASMGRQRTGGYAVEITDVRPANDRLQISIKRKTPAPGAMVTQALTAPFHIVAVPRSDLKPLFIEAKEEKKR